MQHYDGMKFPQIIIILNNFDINAPPHDDSDIEEDERRNGE